jgi:hypothetical protein
MKTRACFTRLALGLRVDLIEGSESRELFEYHRAEIQSFFAAQPDLPLHQDSVAGFLHGFETAELYLVPPGSVERECMFGVYGGAFLVGRHLPVGPARSSAGHRFMLRMAAKLDGWEHEPAPAAAALACALVQDAFVLAGDVPMNSASLGGFCLGLRYALPYLTVTWPGILPLIAAACQLSAALN